MACGIAAAPRPASATEPARCGADALVLPGTATCLRLGGLVRADTRLAARAPLLPGAPDGGRHRAAAALRAQGRADLDARIPTAAGPIRAYLSVGTGDLRR